MKSAKQQSDPLDRGHQALRARDWAAAYSDLSSADQRSPLGPSDSENLAIAAHLSGHDEVGLVGAGNSGADIAIELSRHHTTLLSGTESGRIPWPIETFFARNVCSEPFASSGTTF